MVYGIAVAFKCSLVGLIFRCQLTKQNSTKPICNSQLCSQAKYHGGPKALALGLLGLMDKIYLSTALVEIILLSKELETRWRLCHSHIIHQR